MSLNAPGSIQYVPMSLDHILRTRDVDRASGIERMERPGSKCAY